MAAGRRSAGVRARGRAGSRVSMRASLAMRAGDVAGRAVRCTRLPSAPKAPEPMKPPATPPARPAALVGWRLLALFYDLWPVLAVWMVAGAVLASGYTRAGHDPHENIAPFSPLQFALWGVCWRLAGGYATVSWRRGGQTIGMRPWRLHLAGAD